MNSVELTGRLTREPQISYTSGTNTCVAVFAIAVDRPSKEKQADYPRIRVYGKQAENVEKFVHKGSMIGVEGSIETGSYEKDGQTVYYTDVVAKRVEFINTTQKQAESAEKQAPAVQEQQQIDDFEELDEDVPF